MTDNPLSKPLDFPPQFKDWLSDYIAVNIPNIPITQVYGYHIERIRRASDVDTSESTSSTTYANLATSGPTITKMASGLFIVMFGYYHGDAVRPITHMGISVNGSTPADVDSAFGDRGSPSRAVMIDLRTTAGDNTILAQYRVESGVSDTFANRWLFALKVAEAP